MTQRQIEDGMKQWRVLTPVLLMILSGIMTFTGVCVNKYLDQINSSISSIGGDLKVFMKETSRDIHNMDTRLKVLESRSGVKGDDYASSLEN